jgi:hypothetical protein
MGKLIFIVGASRSGTTMLNRIIGLHGEVMALNELHYFGDIWQPSGKTLDKASLISMAEELLARHYHDLWGGTAEPVEKAKATEIVNALVPEQHNGYQLFSAVMAFISSENSCPNLCEQTPRNIFYAKDILDQYPNAHVIQLIRDPRAVLASQKNRWRRKFLGGIDVPWYEIIRVWVNYHPVTMSHLWNRASNIGLHLENHPRYLRIKFEDIISFPEVTVTKICQFLDLEFQENILDVPKVGSSTRKNVDDSKGVSSDVVDAWQQQVTSGEVYISEKITEANMKLFSYKKMSDRTPLLSLAYNALIFPVHILGVVIINPSRAFVQLRGYLNK